MKDREKEIKYLMYVKSELIKKTKKELKQLNNELLQLNREKKLIREKKNKVKR